jgi:hypothetical protein
MEPSPSLTPPPMGIDQGTQIVEAIGRDKPGGHQFPQSLFHLTR